MAGTCQDAANIATACAKSANSQEFQILSSKMCWDAVVHIATLAGVIDDVKAKTVKGNTIVPPTSLRVDTADAMRNVPPGHMVAFFEEGSPNMIHAMISVGGGAAAGNKNDCIGVGSSVGWEKLDLASLLRWTGSGITAPKGRDPRTGAEVTRSVRVCHRPVTDLA